MSPRVAPPTPRFIQAVKLPVLLAVFSAGGWFGQPEDARMPPADQASVGSRFDPEAATRSYLAKLPLLLVTGWSARLRGWAERRVRFKPIQTIVDWAGYLIVTTVLAFPLTVYRRFFREHAYGLSNQLEEWIFYDHPSGRVRIHTAMRWKAENMPQ